MSNTCIHQTTPIKNNPLLDPTQPLSHPRQPDPVTCPTQPNPTTSYLRLTAGLRLQGRDVGRLPRVHRLDGGDVLRMRAQVRRVAAGRRLQRRDGRAVRRQRRRVTVDRRRVTRDRRVHSVYLLLLVRVDRLHCRDGSRMRRDCRLDIGQADLHVVYAGLSCGSVGLERGYVCL